MKDLNEYKKIALENHEAGNNCSQSTFLTFIDLVDLDKSVGFSMMEGFGAGMGGKMGTCGAISGAIAIISLLASSGDVANISKQNTYRIISKLTDDFTKRAKSLYCYQIKGEDNENNIPLVSCNEAIIIAVELAYYSIITNNLV